MGLEQKINYQLNKYPKVKKYIKRFYQRTMYTFSKKIKSEGNIERISPNDNEHEYFFGYYDKSPWDINDRYMLCLKAHDTWSDVSPKEKADILIIDTEKNEDDVKRVTKIGETNAWNVQQSCMLQWLGPNFDNKILYNDFRNGKYCAVILEISFENGIKVVNEKVINASVYSVSQDGKTALTLDFSRLYNLRPGYGYYNEKEKTEGISLPDTTAIWKIDLLSGEVTPLLKYTDFAKFEPREEMLEQNSVHKVNHIMISPNGKRFMVLYRWFNGQRKYTRLITCNIDGTEMYVLSDDDMVSHCFWKNDDYILAFENKKDGGPGYYLMKDKTTEYKRCWPQFSNDGHPSYSPDGKYVVTDSYPNRARIAEINLMNADEEKTNNTTIARVFAPFKYDNDTRCDLHPRWNRKGNKICFDSVFEGHRGLYVVNITEKKYNNIEINKEEKKVSCVIPTHNRSDLLVRAVKSAQNQTYKNLEIIVVSDGSTDKTKEIMEQFCENDRRIKFIEYFPAKGGNIARNTGIENSNGEYIAFLDDDDEWLPEKIEEQVKLMSNENVGLVYTGVNIIYVNEDVKYSFIGKKRGNLSKSILLDNCIGTTSTVMVRKKLLEKAGKFDINLKALQDFDLWIRLCQLCEVDVVEREMLNYYNYTGKKQVSAVTQKYIDAFEYLNKKYEMYFEKLNIKEKEDKIINEKMLLANKALRNDNGKLGRYYLKEVFKLSKSKKVIILYLASYFKYKYILKLRSLI